MKTLRVSCEISSSGFSVLVNRKKYSLQYPQHIWQKFPVDRKQQLAQTAAYIFTHHLAVEKNNQLLYDFPPPAIRSLFFHGFLYSIAATSIEFPESHQTTESLIKKLYNSDFRIQFTGTVPSAPTSTVKEMDPKTAVVPFSLGKDSLLTYALLKDMHYKIIPVLFYEPSSPHENEQKKILIKKFENEFSTKIFTIENTLGNLREGAGLMWGWDMLLLQYTVLLIPFSWVHKANFLFWSNEQSINEIETDKHGYTLNPTHEQSKQWTMSMSHIFRSFGLDTTVSSLVEPLHELMIIQILHHKFPLVGAYQHSCFGDISKPNKRWCGNCYECARVFIFLVAVGINPYSLGFEDNMLRSSKRSLYYLFEKKHHDYLHSLYQSLEEVQLAFILANARHARSELLQLYNSMYSVETHTRYAKLLRKYITVHDSQTMPLHLSQRMKSFYIKEAKIFRKQITKGQLIPAEIFLKSSGVNHWV